jgi:hypothetical protein
MNLEDFSPFCSGYNKKMEKPWSRGDFTYASDGFIVIRVPRREDCPEIENPVNAEAIFNVTPEPVDGFIALPSIEKIGELKVCPKCKGKALEECPECDGEGELDIRSDFNTYTVECKSCGGEGDECAECHGAGNIEPTPTVEIGGSMFTTPYIRALIALPGAQIAVNRDSRKASWIKFKGGDALLMARSCGTHN